MDARSQGPPNNTGAKESVSYVYMNPLFTSGIPDVAEMIEANSRLQRVLSTLTRKSVLLMVVSRTHPLISAR